MSDLVQKIADAVEVALGDDGHCVVYKNEAVKEAIRQALGSTQERGEAVEQIAAAIADEAAQEWVDLGGSRVHYRTANWAALRMAQELGRAHPTPDAGRVAELEAQLAESRERGRRMREALIEVSATLAWTAHGECRAIHDGPIMPSAMAIEAAKAALAADKEQK